MALTPNMLLRWKPPGWRKFSVWFQVRVWKSGVKFLHIGTLRPTLKLVAKFVLRSSKSRAVPQWNSRPVRNNIRGLSTQRQESDCRFCAQRQQTTLGMFKIHAKTTFLSFYKFQKIILIDYLIFTMIVDFVLKQFKQNSKN